ncbi:hypothetical protein BC833DRAFT_526905 [Globomyces pollinis-pini]|nr:hypothetical protein BC833DRAFT_526905 [Globomyces pollinis-pini]
MSEPTHKVDQCNCYCCPSKSNPYGIQESCNITSPDFVGSFPIGNPMMCSAIGCFTNFSVNCPFPPIHGPKNTSGSIKWGCGIGCRFSLDGTTIVNSTSFDVGMITGLDDSFNFAMGSSCCFYYLIFWLFLM